MRSWSSSSHTLKQNMHIDRGRLYKRDALCLSSVRYVLELHKLWSSWPQGAVIGAPAVAFLVLRKKWAEVCELILQKRPLLYSSHFLSLKHKLFSECWRPLQVHCFFPGSAQPMFPLFLLATKRIIVKSPVCHVCCFQWKSEAGVSLQTSCSWCFLSLITWSVQEETTDLISPRVYLHSCSFCHDELLCCRFTVTDCWLTVRDQPSCAVLLSRMITSCFALLQMARVLPPGFAFNDLSHFLLWYWKNLMQEAVAEVIFLSRKVVQLSEELIVEWLSHPTLNLTATSEKTESWKQFNNRTYSSFRGTSWTSNTTY